MKLRASKNPSPSTPKKEPQDQLRKRLIARKDPFVCANCGAKNLRTSGKPLNHRSKCLYSLHVDEAIPGDRQSQCQGLMKPETVSIGRKGIYIITHQCTNCGKVIPNQAAPDDNIDLIISLINANPKLAR
ncbi:MAG: RNHCP domain-containing protein [Candidatus Gracilibacteria bacterium]